MSKILRLLFWCSAIALLTWAYFSPQFRDAEGFLEGTFCLPFSVGVALMILGITAAGRLKRPAFWFALALVGQGVALQMIEAGPRGEYQHYVRPLTRLIVTHPLLICFLALQTVLVAAGLRRHWEKIRGWLGHNFKAWQLLCVGSVFFLSSATLSREIPVYVSELFFASFIQAVNLANIILMVWALPESFINDSKRKLDKLFGHAGKAEGNPPFGIDVFAGAVALWVTVLAALLCFFSYERIPHIPDEAAYLYQAQYFAEGLLTMPSPPVPEAFDIELMHFEGNRWYSAQLPGWPAMLSLGVLVGFPWLVNPILAGINVLLAFLFVRDLYDRRTARITVLLLCFSPWYVIMAMNFMTHTFTLTLALIGAVTVVRARRTGKAIWGWIGGLSVGMMSLIRPLEALAIAGLLGLWAIGVGGRRLKTSAIVGLVLGSIVVGSAGLYYNKQITGDPIRFPFAAYTDKYYKPGSNSLGFGPERGAAMNWTTLDPIPGHGFIDVLINANFNIFSLNIELFGWSTGSLLMIAVIFFSGAVRGSDYLMLAVIGAIIGIHTFYWFSGGPGFGARYWYLIIVPCVALTARSIQYLAGRLVSGPTIAATRDKVVMVGALSLCLITLLNYFPWRAIDKYHHYRSIRPGIQKLAREYGFGRSLILVRGNRHVDYASAAIYNSVNFQDDKPIYVLDRSPEIRTKLLKSYPDRKVWIVNGPSISHKGFKVISGPFSATELLSRNGKL